MTHGVPCWSLRHSHRAPRPSCNWRAPTWQNWSKRTLAPPVTWRSSATMVLVRRRSMPEQAAKLDLPLEKHRDQATTAESTFGPELAQLVVVLLWASTFVVAKSAFAEVAPLAFTFVRFVLMIGLALAVLFVRQPG